MQLHPIMYVPDQYAERDFYLLLGFEMHYEGGEFPGFLALRSDDVVIGLQAASGGHPPYREGLRWQFEVDTVEEIDEVLDTCRAHDLYHEVSVETGGTAFRTRIVAVRSPANVMVCFEGPNEASGPVEPAA